VMVLDVLTQTMLALQPGGRNVQTLTKEEMLDVRGARSVGCCKGISMVSGDNRGHADTVAAATVLPAHFVRLA